MLTEHPRKLRIGSSHSSTPKYSGVCQTILVQHTFLRSCMEELRLNPPLPSNAWAGQVGFYSLDVAAGTCALIKVVQSRTPHEDHKGSWRGNVGGFWSSNKTKLGLRRIEVRSMLVAMLQCGGLFRGCLLWRDRASEVTRSGLSLLGRVGVHVLPLQPRHDKERVAIGLFLRLVLCIFVD